MQEGPPLHLSDLAVTEEAAERHLSEVLLEQARVMVGPAVQPRTASETVTRSVVPSRRPENRTANPNPLRSTSCLKMNRSLY